MKKYLILPVLLLAFCGLRAQTNYNLNLPAVGHGATNTTSTYRFTHAGYSVGHYALGWYQEVGAAMAYLSGYSGIKLFTAGEPRLYIELQGNVGIGTLYPKEKLSVNGVIVAKEVKVQAAPWADYVFKKDYRLAPLSEVERFVKEKGHLPGMPDAATVSENGVALGELNRKLLEKVEELTLHLIAKEKEIGELRGDLQGLSVRLDSLSR